MSWKVKQFTQGEAKTVTYLQKNLEQKHVRTVISLLITDLQHLSPATETRLWIQKLVFNDCECFLIIHHFLQQMHRARNRFIQMWDGENQALVHIILNWLVKLFHLFFWFFFFPLFPLFPRKICFLNKSFHFTT